MRNYVSWLYLGGHTLSGSTVVRCLAYPWTRVCSPVAAPSLTICSPHLHRAIRGAQGVLSCVGLGVMTSHLDLPSLTPLSVADYGLLKLGVPHWAISVALLQVVDN